MDEYYRQREMIEANFASTIQLLTPDWGHEISHLEDTPRRVTQYLREFFVPAPNPAEILKTTFASEYAGLVALTSIPFTSICPHHLLPFQGKCSVGYLPNGRIVGLSKIVRWVEAVTHRPVVQEEATRSIIEGIENELAPKGTIVVVTATHGCIEARGPRTPGVATSTIEVRGLFKTNDAGVKDEFLAAMKWRV